LTLVAVMLAVCPAGFSHIRVFGLVASAQQRSATKSAAKPGIVSGRVFAVTKSSDLKPARMAKIYLIYVSPIYRSAKAANVASKEEQDTAGLAWTSSLTKAKEEEDQALEGNNKAFEELTREKADIVAKKQGVFDIEQMRKLDDAEGAIVAKQATITAGWSDSVVCRKELLEYQGSLVEALKWASAQRKEWQVIRADTDEDGVFKFKIPRPGTYMLVAHGQAGFNEAFWVSENFVANLGAETSLKLSEPEKACMTDER
jgi:hypothetical protein